ncbi:hypothetical protein [Bacillus sp. 7894-2]|uniref:hypothetical protein n=1 Tax=Bacillus sp. 7894-2 TaxID=2021695 RepID=UPI000BA7BDB6|nr:hypothetical protein [Bacillus sp. 7894-2]PAE24072.1 hypothetical protein CHI10_14820 [Bacillus sp. 7894-2]
MAKVKVIGAYVDGHGPGSIVEVNDKTAAYLERIGYGKIQVETEQKEAKEEPKSKPKAKAKSKSKSKPKGDE